MKQIIRKIQEPYPQNNRPWLSTVIAGTIVFLILYLFRPFNIGTGMDSQEVFISTFGFVLVSVIIEAVYHFVSRKLFDPNKWTVGKSIISNISLLILIAIGISLLGTVVYGWSFNLRVFCIVLGMVICVGIFPIVIITLINQNRLLKLHIREVGEINRSISKNVINKTSIRIGDFLIDSDKLLYVESSGNYVTVCYIDNEKLKQKTVRATLKSIEEQTNLVKCHRAFIVNLDKVIHAEGNSQGYRLFLEGLEQQIPVSRAYTSIVKGYFR